MSDTAMTSQLAFQPTSLLFMTSPTFPNFVRQVASVCYVTLAAQSRLMVSALELRASNTQSTCSRRLYVTDDVTQVSMCARNTSSFTEQDNVFVFDNVDEDETLVQFGLVQEAAAVDGSVHVWLQLQSKHHSF